VTLLLHGHSCFTVHASHAVFREQSKSGGRNQHIVTELLATEEDYLHDLGVILSVYGTALKVGVLLLFFLISKAVVAEEDFRRVFSNLEHVHAVHIQLLADLKGEASFFVRVLFLTLNQ
jgi:hypothetical protein